MSNTSKTATGANERARSCENRIERHLEDRLADLRHLRDADSSLPDYGLGFDYVAPFTFSDQPEGYFRYQLSWAARAMSSGSSSIRTSPAIASNTGSSTGSMAHAARCPATMQSF